MSARGRGTGRTPPSGALAFSGGFCIAIGLERHWTGGIFPWWFWLTVGIFLMTIYAKCAFASSGGDQ